MTILAVQYIRPVNQGWTLPHLFKCEDGQTYVVKFINNRAGPGILANELIAYRLGQWLGLPIAPYRIVQITKDLLDVFPALKSLDIPAGLHLGSLYFEQGTTLFKKHNLALCKNLYHSAGMIVFDHWINNWDRHIAQDNLLYLPDQQKIQMIDHSDAFFGPDWNKNEFMDDANKMDIFWGPIYEVFVPFIDSPDPFGHYVSLVEKISEKTVIQAVKGLPKQWGISREDVTDLIDFLLCRRKLVRNALEELRDHFPIWTQKDDG
ncbi:HipA family kinase [Paenibacillus donghaensis]|uniref:HipA-like kinase domain-containing protein n=1 Tax=Paenibacillus donghaensis TaxID=414771 RepID=A0A2Z2K927_9BACL|nr:HipA family kinase [Paenibacillus donghaensis]ASA19855.1 hypothetical protein B9T62_02975 [Paenibacillus donghaensis]